MAASADDTLATLTGLLNATSNGQSLFSGTNTGASPIRDGAAAAAKTNAVAAFQSAFGFPPSDARTADLTAAQIQGFLEGTVAAQFADPNWGTTWSQASSTAITSRISLTETVTTSVGANETAFRQLAEAALVSSLGMTGLSAEPRRSSHRAMSLLSKGSAGLVSLQADLGRARPGSPTPTPGSTRSRPSSPRRSPAWRPWTRPRPRPGSTPRPPSFRCRTR